MKLFSLLALGALFAPAALAQRAVIGAPQDGTTVHPGQNLTVEIDRPDSLTGSTEVAVVIGFFSCGSSPAATCPPPTDVLGSVLYNGPYDPEFHTGVSRPPHQNFTVTVPPFAPAGKAQLGVAHLSLVGAGQFPLFETLNVTLKVEV
ncbi:hypothetical protein R3P38DRAFT_1646729 [Favolaschia claudopus]|uniref:Uncharacterized protein n=1 Tax=Favolaschia claudopus TaxID=2862362 RepID=A0AAW0DL44_9AGAR